MNIFAIMAIFILDISAQPHLLILLWLMYSVLTYVWGGAANLIRAIFFPGYLLRRLMQSLILRKFGESARLYAIEEHGEEWARVYIRLSGPFVATCFIIGPVLVALPLYYLTIVLSTLSPNFIAKIVAAWFAISLFVTGLPGLKAMEPIVESLIIYTPLMQVLLLWSVVIFILSLNAFDISLAVIITLSYIFLVILINSMGVKREQQTPIILNED